MIVTLIGMQWGDEGKGKFIDYLAYDVDWVIRYAGCANVGHTIVHDDKKYAFHLLPTGILNPKVMVLLGPAMVLDPAQMLKELELLEENNIEWKGRVFAGTSFFLNNQYCLYPPETLTNNIGWRFNEHSTHTRSLHNKNAPLSYKFVEFPEDIEVEPSRYMWKVYNKLFYPYKIIKKEIRKKIRNFFAPVLRPVKYKFFGKPN